MAHNGNADGDVQEGDGFLYTILNVTKDATQAEVHDRYRSLSLVFHPDKQTEEQLKVSATKEFLKIQKAYQVLSDPFLRQIYDTLGSEGLKIQWPVDVRSKSREEMQEILNQMAISLQERKIRDSASLTGKVACSLDVSPVVDELAGVPSFPGLRNGIRRIRVITKSLALSVERKITEKTAIIFKAESAFQRSNGALHFLGTVRHQFSPRITALATIHLTEPHFAKLGATYEDSNNFIEVKTALSPVDLLPTVATTYSRKLFRDRPHRGRISLNISHSPSISFFFISPAILRLEAATESPKLSPPSISGLKYFAFEKRFGITFDNVLPKLVAEGAIHLIELSTRLRASLQCGLTGLLATLGITWNNEKVEAGTFLVFSAEAVLWETNFSYLDVQFSIPIFLSTHFSPALALTAAVIPCTAISLGYHFFILPHRRARRLAHIRAARQAFEEDSDARKDRNAVEFILKEAVKKQIRIETGRDGLIIQEATYGAAETDKGDSYVTLNVTTQLQALVRNSQLHIPGGDSRTALQGFSDPAPFVQKSLRMRYLFRNRAHYAEIPDYLPVILPLAEHEVSYATEYACK